MKRFFVLISILLCFSILAYPQSEIRLLSSQRILIDSSYDDALDASLRRYLAPYQANLQRQMHTVLGNAAETIAGGDPCGALNYWVADLMLKQMQAVRKEKIDMTVVNNHAFRKPLPEGPITLADVYECLPFDNEMVLLTMRGRDVRSLMKSIARRGTESFANAQISVKDGRLLTVNIAGEPLQDERLYTVLSIDYLAEGSGGMTAFRKAENKVYCGVMLRDLMVRELEAYSRTGKLLEAKVDQRYRIEP